MKKRITFILTIIMAVSMLMASVFPASAETISPRLSNTDNATVAFSIESNGAAHFAVDYSGRDGVFTEARVSVKIEKQFLFFFWTTEHEWSASCTDLWGVFGKTFYLSGSGTYRANFTLKFYGTSGEVDTITDTIEDSY